MYSSHILNDISGTKEKRDFFDNSTYAISHVMPILDRRSYLYRVRKKKCSNANRIFNTSFQKSLKPFAHRWMRENLLRFGTAEQIKFTRGYNDSEMTERVSLTTYLPLDSRWPPAKLRVSCKFNTTLSTSKYCGRIRRIIA